MRVSLLVALAAVAFVGCQLGAAPEPTATPVATLQATPVATLQAIPTATPESLSLLRTPVATPPSPPRPRETPTPTGPTPMPTNTPEPTVSPQVIRQASLIQERVERLREALRDGDAETLLRLQREIAPEVARVAQLAQQDPSKQGQQIAAALDELRSGLAGNLPKLDGGQRQLAQALGATAATPDGTATGGGVKPIDNLSQYAAGLVDKATAFEAALQEGRTSDLLRLQDELLSELERGRTLQNRPTKQAETIRSALEDLRNALGGDRTKLASAMTKLQQAAGRAAPTGSGSQPSAQPVDVQPLANELNNRLGNLAQALDDPADKEAIASAQSELVTQARKAEDAIRNDRSPRAERLRRAIGIVREVAGGDGNKIDAARAALQDAMNGG